MVTDGNNIHFTGVKSSQAPNMAKSIYSESHHCISGTRLALHKKMQLSADKEEQRT